MRIFDPKDQLGNSLLSQADTALSSKRLEKQMAEGRDTITLTSADIGDIEKWELCNASVIVDGKAVNFLPETSKDEYGNITVVFGQYFENVILVLKRVEFGAMCEQERLTIEVKIRRLMGMTMAAATAPTTREEEEIEANVAQWKALGQEAYDTDSDKYANAKRNSLGGYHISGTGEVVVDDYFLSVDALSDPEMGGIVVAGDVTGIKWHADLPCLMVTDFDNCFPKEIIEFTGKIPNVTDASSMFDGCTGLTSWTVALPNSLTNTYEMFSGCTGLKSFSTPSGSLPDSLTIASGMFQDCSGLTSWDVELPNSLTIAYSMFYGCSGLKSWTVKLPDSLTAALGMFYGCSSLREFTPSLAGLTNCESFISMFSGCILNEESIRNILDTLPDRKNKDELWIEIGGDVTIEQSVKQQLSSLAQSVSTAKNWDIVLEWNTPPTE